MKVTFTANSKKVITIAETPTARQMIETLKDDGCTVKEFAEMAARVASGSNVVKVLDCSAEISKNCRACDNYTDDSGDLDVWVDFTAIIDGGFGGIIMGGAYLTDIWSIAGDNHNEIRRHMFIRKFTETK